MEVQRQVSLSLSYNDADYSKSFLGGLMCLRNVGQYVDVILKAGSLEIPCHKVVLSAASEYFQAMFESGLEESISRIVEVRGTDSSTLKAIIDYIYSAEIDITTQNVQNLVEACDLFRFAGLKHACEEFMQQQIDPYNCIGFYQFAKLYNLKTLQESARLIMLTRFKEVVKSSEYLNLTYLDLIEYISDDKLNVVSEDPVFEAVLIWTKHDCSSRHLVFDQLLEHIKLPFCSSPYLCYVVSSNEYVQTPIGRKYLEEARTYHMLADYRHQLCNERTTPRTSFCMSQRLVVVGGLTKQDRENRYCWYLKEETSSWELLAQLPRPNWKFYSVCVIPHGILITGGYHSNVKRDCWLFDTMEKKWKPIAAMIEARCKHRTLLHSGGVFVFGGEDDYDRPLRSVERFDLRIRQWKCGLEMPKALSDPLAVSFGQYVFVFGGIEENDETSTCTLAYDSVWNEWHAKSMMPQPCRLGAVTLLNDDVYIIGGYTKSCMRYRPLDDTWTLLTPPREKHGNAPIVVWRGRILLGGGDFDTSETTSIVEEYHPGDDKWLYWQLPLKEELSCHYMLNVDLHGI